MPIYVGNNVEKRLKLGNVEIKRVYLGSTLEYGLYNITYYDRDEDTSTYEPKKYVWGESIDLKTFDDYFDSYKTHYDGWYEDKVFTTLVEKIKKDDHKDFTLYAKWRQKKFEYSGKYGYRKITTTGQTATEWWNKYYPGTSSPYVGQCTWYANGRTAEMRGDRSTSAPQGRLSNNYGAAKTWCSTCVGNWSNTDDPSKVQVGDVVVFTSSGTGHVVVIEEILSTTPNYRFKVSDFNWNHIPKLHTAEWTHGNSYGSTTFLGYIINHEDLVVTPGEVDWTECDDQDNPTMPDPPSGSWIEENKRTQLRTIDYDSTWTEWRDYKDYWELTDWEE